MQPYFENDFVIITYNKPANALIHRWKRNLSSAEFKEGLNALLPAFEHFKTGKVIADTICMGAISLEDQHWSVTDWANAAKGKGYSHIAFVLPSEVFTQLVVANILENAPEHVVTGCFDNEEVALHWIHHSPHAR